jgi:hypothetical protein
MKEKIKPSTETIEALEKARKPEFTDEEMDEVHKLNDSV